MEDVYLNFININFNSLKIKDLSFSKEIREEIFVKSARHCCVCHKPAGLNMEIHHIKPKKQGGDDSFENAIALCFDCHSDAGHYFAGHPKGSKLSPEELRKHKESWFAQVEKYGIEIPSNEVIELIVENKDFDGIFRPIFIKEETLYFDRESQKKLYELAGKNPMDTLNKIKEMDDFNSPFYDSKLKNVENYDEFLDYLSSDDYEFEDELSNTNCQPVTYHLNGLRFSTYKEINLSNCVLDLRLKNVSPQVLENYKLYLKFNNVVEVDSVDKQKKYLDTYEYKYNVKFTEKFKCQFVPENEILVQKDSIRIDSVCFRASHHTKSISIDWEFFARNIHKTGRIEFQIVPEFEKSEKAKYINLEEEKESTIRILPKLKFD